MKAATTIFFALAFAVNFSRAQLPPQISADVAAQIVMRPQPPVDSSQLGIISAQAEFDPPAVRPGEKTFYRVTINATQNSILWPDDISSPPELRLGSAKRGQLAQADGTPFHPLTEFIYEATPAAAGRMVISNFTVTVGTQSVEVPAATLDVSETAAASTPARKLILDVPRTNLFLGQPFQIRVLLPAEPGHRIEAVRDVQFNGTGFLTDKLATHQMIGGVTNGGAIQAAYIYETTAIPIAAGPLTISVQGFTVPPFSAGAISITAGSGPITLGGTGQTPLVLLVSDAVHLNVRPLPTDSELPGFTGAMGKFLADKPLCSTNRVRVGEPLHLKTGFHGDGTLARFVPPAVPRSRDWQIIADKPLATGFTLIPQTDAATSTPAIPFCAFDPATGKYYDLTVPALPITVVGDGLPVKLADEENQDEPTPKLSGLAATPGRTTTALKPLQLQGRFVLLQILPVYGLFLLWQWDQRRRFWEAHPDLHRRHLARQALRRERRKLAATADASTFARHAVTAMQIAVAPHFPAQPDALVGGDVLAVLGANEPEAATVRKLFSARDARFAVTPETAAPLPAWRDEVFAALKKLEGKL